MDLPNLFNRLKPEKEEIKQFFAIEIGLDSIKTASWQVVDGQTKITSTGSVEPWEGEAENLLTAIDKSLASNTTGNEKEPDEVIFGLPSSWINKAGITETAKDTLKTVCQKLGLKPVGFVVIPEAIVFYLRELEGGPPSAILVHLANKSVAVSLVRLGDIQGTQVVGRSHNLAADVQEALARFPKTGDNLPSRIILFNGHHDLEAAKQNLIAFNWQQKLAFLHFPKIEGLEPETTIKAVALGGGAEVAKSMGISVTKSVASEPTAESMKAASPSLVTNKPLDQAGAFASAADVGFKQVTVKEEEEPIQAEPEMSAEEKASHDNIVAPASPLELSPESTSPATEEANDDSAPSFVIHGGDSIPISKKPLLPALPKLPTLKLPSFKKGFKFPPLIPIIVGVALVLVVGIGLAYVTVPSAEVNVYLNLHPLEKEVSFTLDPSIQSVDIASNRIPGIQQTIDVSGSQTAAATGEKTVGERAKGQVILYNRTTTTKSFPQGTTLTAGQLKFTLDANVTIASASTKENADFSVTTQPSQTEASITAAAIGPEYNLGTDAQLRIANFATDSYVAAPKTALSGGSSREILAVSEADQENLKTLLLEELKNKSKAELQAKTSGEQSVITTNNQEIVSESYSAEVGDEATSVSLNMAIKQVVYAYTFTDVLMLTQQKLSQEIPSGYLIKPDETGIEVLESQVNEAGVAEVKAKVVLKLMPKLNEDEIKQAIKGKSPTKVADYFRSLPGYARVETNIKPGFFPTYPYKGEKITIKLKANQ